MTAVARAEGPLEVAALLRRVADGVESGTVELAGEQRRCPDGLVASLEAGDGVTAAFLTIRLSADGMKPAASLGVEQELSHPGG